MDILRRVIGAVYEKYNNEVYEIAKHNLTVNCE
jgi:hypothetical protein